MAFFLHLNVISSAVQLINFLKLNKKHVICNKIFKVVRYFNSDKKIHFYLRSKTWFYNFSLPTHFSVVPKVLCSASRIISILYVKKRCTSSKRKRCIRFSLEINVLVTLHCSIVLEQHAITRAHFKDSRFIHHIKDIYVGFPSVVKRYIFLINIKIMMLHENIHT